MITLSLQLPETVAAEFYQAADQLNQRYGRGTVKVSGQGAYSAWQMKQERKSPNYTTDWQNLPCV